MLTLRCLSRRQLFNGQLVRCYSSSSSDANSSSTSTSTTAATDKNSNAAFSGLLRMMRKVEQDLKKSDSKQHSVSSSEADSSTSHLPQSSSIDDVSFATLFRNSQLVRWGDVSKGLVTKGEIKNVMGDDLYIDFGHKFMAVCTRPRKNGHLYVRNAKVSLHVHDLELSTRFLGSETDMTLLEADATILRLLDSPLMPARRSSSDASGLASSSSRQASGSTIAEAVFDLTRSQEDEIEDPSKRLHELTFERDNVSDESDAAYHSSSSEHDDTSSSDDKLKPDKSSSSR